MGTTFTVHEYHKDSMKKYENCCVIYEKNLFGLKGPRKMTVLFPSTDNEKMDQLSLLEKYKNEAVKDLLVLENKSPQWNEETQSYVLNFSGRVTMASVKNFQIVHGHDCDIFSNFSGLHCNAIWSGGN